MEKINYSTIIESVAQKTGFPVKDVSKIIGVFIDEIKAYILQGCTVIIKNFAKFQIEKAASKKTWNFQTKGLRVLPRRYLPKASFVPEFVKKVKDLH